MNRFYNMHCVCFHGDCTVTMPDNSKRLVKELKKGDTVKTGNGLTAQIRCILKTVYPSKQADLI